MTLLPGTYLIDVSGEITGVFGGSYAGVLNVTPTPVPEPSIALLMALGLLALAAPAYVRRLRSN